MTLASQPQPPLITIALPTYNGSAYLEETLQSALAQIHPALDIVVVDDGSRSDEAAAVAAMIERLAQPNRGIRFFRQQNAGIAEARNAAYAHADAASEYVLFLDHDDLLAPDAIAALVFALQQCPDCPAAHGKTSVIDYCGQPVAADPTLIARLGLERRRLRGARLLDSLRGAFTLPDTEDTTFATLLYANCITSVGAVLMRRSALESAGAFQKEFAPNDEWELYLRLARQGPFRYVPRTVLSWRMHGSNSSAGENRMRDAYLRIMQDVAATRLPPPFREQVRTVMLYRAAAVSRAILLHPARSSSQRREYVRILRAAAVALLRN